jgi:4-hydroxy-3-methylbut-2-enyl diphosphate reductase
MKVTVAKTAGFCFGVDRAVSLVEEAAASGKKVVTLGPIIHNRHVVSRFESMGVHEIKTVDEAPNDAVVVIRSHGVGRAVYDALNARGLEIVDATCPFVSRIHKIAHEASEQGRTVLIVGDHTHPEVLAIAGWCRTPLVFENASAIEAWLAESEKNASLPLTAVCQTTNTQNVWAACTNLLKKECTNCEIFDTICNATEKRQKEAAILADACDAVVVVGDAASSNTKRLYELCKERCASVCLIDQAADLDMQSFKGDCSVGITAGASTPSWIIKEVSHKMSDEMKELVTPEVAEPAVAAEKSVDTTVEAGEESFEELLEQSFKTLNTGDKVTGIVTGISPTEVYVDLGAKQAGYIPYDQVSSDPNVKPEDLFKVGDEIEVAVVRVNDVEGVVTLSKKRLDANKGWEEVEAAMESKEPVEVTISEVNAGGVVGNYKGVRVFVPASQSGVPKGGDLEKLLKQTVKLRITEVNRSRRRVVGSIRAVSSEARKAAADKIWAEIEVGKKYHGTVKSLTSYGAFVDIGGVDGMVHVSKLSWNRIKTPADVVSVGDEIDVFVIALDPEKRRISLGYKTPETNPWTIFTTNYHVGDVVKAKIVKLMDFGAFAEILPGVDGLIHISQIADRRIGKPEDVLSEGQEVDVKITDVDTERKRISLSIRALLETEQPAAQEEEADTYVPSDEPEAAMVYSSENPIAGQNELGEDAE